MDAVISGRAGTALIVDGNTLFSFDVDEPDTLVPRAQSDLPYLFGDARDLQFLENIGQQQIRKRLELEYNVVCALDLALILMDATLSAGVRQEAAAELEELFSDTTVLERLEGILYARPLPDSADITGAKERSEAAQASTTLMVMDNLLSRQPFIRDVCAAWDGIPESEFGGTEQKAEFQRLAIREGLFRALVIAHEDRQVESFLIHALMLPTMQALRNYRMILPRWTASFRQPAIVHENLVADEEEETDTGEQEKRGRQYQQHQRINRSQVLATVESRKRVIVEHLQHRDFARANSLIDELVNYQLANGGPKFTVMSLCDLAMEAKALDNHQLQLELTERSIRLKKDDSWSWAQYADALLIVGRHIDALNAYEQAGMFGAGVVAKTGRAEVLRAMGRLSEALAAYDTVIAEHPENVVAKNGRAEVLRAMGRLSEALAAYDHAGAEHPESVVAKRGRAETLRAIGKLQDALVAYDNIIAADSGDVIAKTGRAETLRTMGRLSEALAAYDSVIAEYPENVVAQSGRAEVLRAMGRLPEALAAYDTVIAEHPESVVAKNGRAEVLRAMGRLSEALAAYDSVIAEYPENVVAQSGRAEVLRAMGKLHEALAAYDSVIAEHPESVVAQNGRAETLRTMGHLPEALAAYEEIRSRFPNDMVARNARSSILAALHRYNEALADLPTNEMNSRQDWIGFHIRGMIFLKMGRVDEALNIFEQGVIGNPWPSDREFFRTALGMAWMRQQNYLQAASVFNEVKSPALQPQVDILRVHSYGENQQYDIAQEIYERVAANPLPETSALTEELNRRYVQCTGAQQDDEWVFEQEDNLLLAANQSLTSSLYAY
ncbi:MAG TPA: tetratricopeptide repeat protein [Blastocatellia bacterium]|nr:tetratricopeptide repeat protein [Blastocatellia bacterium]